MPKTFIIGTRDSKLATWQAEWVAKRLGETGQKSQLKYIKTEGDLVLDTPLPMMGGKGVFTKALDDALLSGKIDLAVHSFKDIPTRLPEGLKIAAIASREDHRDVLVTRKGLGFLEIPGYNAVIASSSLRRMSQWLYRYPGHTMSDIRGNVQTRLRKLKESDWDGAIFAAAGLIRLEMQDVADQFLDWMVPAPAQGAMAVMVRDGDTATEQALTPVHHPETALCTSIERDYLNELEGGCSAPIAALATIEDGKVFLKATISNPDGTGRIDTELSQPMDQARDLGRQAARIAIEKGAGEIVSRIKG
ncbi:MAG: hydroxymethylbilane synthase [Balneolales bacterium]